MDQKCTNDIRFYYNKDLDENLAWLTQKTEDPKNNRGNLSFRTHTVNVIEPLISGSGVVVVGGSNYGFPSLKTIIR